VARVSSWLHTMALMAEGKQSWITIDADAVTKMSICEDVGTFRNGQRSSTATAGSVILLLEGGDSWLGQLSWRSWLML